MDRKSDVCRVFDNLVQCGKTPSVRSCGVVDDFAAEYRPDFSS